MITAPQESIIPYINRTEKSFSVSEKTGIFRKLGIFNRDYLDQIGVSFYPIELDYKVRFWRWFVFSRKSL
ncbi:hypothetical protein LEP1GSC016_1902 [Leptospira borgpetersenii serovar Hardjo-bovis str. Sponselee]|uniref:Uncharacterized protein n=1 Tax=Leptospira borgpetersenii serovar Hardjo-bovis str. Sponselee TaxID=1303729 RepID=M6BU01_LEPBO|nr:hypothetical protein LEP1GSC016_1902 [Leptospira borgpetersenii serovar Hardjo-bovis str. Sponselee]